MLNCLVGETAFSWSFLWSLKGNMETRFNSQSNNPKNVLTKYGLRWVFWFLPSHTLHTLLWRGSHPDNPVAEKKNDSLIRALLVHLYMCVWILGTSNRHPQSWVCVIFNTPILHLPRFCHWFDFKARTVRAMSVCPFITLSCTFLKRNFFVRPCFGSWNDLE